jgi:hypothetical protein
MVTGEAVALLFNSFDLAASLHAQILASKGTVTSCEVMALSESMTIGKALAPWLIRPTMVVVGLVRVPPNFLQLWMNLIFFCLTTSIMLFGSSVMALIFSFFEFSAVIALMKALKFLLAVSVSFAAQRCACQLLLDIGRLPTDVLHVTFYELPTVVETIIAVADLIWDAGDQKMTDITSSVPKF